MNNLFFKWIIPDFMNNKKNILTSEEFNYPLKKGRWFLQLHPFGHPNYEGATSLFLHLSPSQSSLSSSPSSSSSLEDKKDEDKDNEQIKVKVKLSIGNHVDEFIGKFDQDNRLIGNYTFFEHVLTRAENKHVLTRAENVNKQIFEQDGSLIIKCLIIPQHEIYLQSETTLNVHSEEMLQMILDQDKGQDYDLTIKLNDGEIKCHQNVISSSSKVLRHLINSKNEIDLRSDKESQESRLGSLNLDYKLIKSFLEFIYAGKINLKSVNEAIKLFQVGFIFEVKKLKKLTEFFISSNLTANEAIDALIIGHFQDSKKIKDAALNIMKGKDSDEIKNWNKIEKYPQISYLLITKMWKFTDSYQIQDKTSQILNLDDEIDQEIRQQHVSNFISIYKSKINTNLVFSFPAKNGFQLFAHKNLLRSRSRYFYDVIDEHVQEIVIRDVDLDIFEQLLNYIYSGLILMNKIENAIKIFVAASNYGIDSLIPILEDYISDNLDSSSLISALIAGHENGSDKIVNSCLESIKTKKSCQIKDFKRIYSHSSLIDKIFKLRDELIN